MTIESILKKLVSFNSTAGNKKSRHEAVQYVYSLFKGRCYMKILTKNNVDSLIIAFSKKAVMRPTVTFHGHLDIVEADKKQLSMKKTKTEYVGRGVQDMKGGCAVFIKLIDDILKQKSKPDINFLFTTDEEMGGFDGVGYAIEKGLSPEFVITGESSDLKISLASKGILWVCVTALGTPAHAAYYTQGDNALIKLNKTINKIQRQFPTPKDMFNGTTVNVSYINTRNQTVNKVPDFAEMLLDIRYFTQRTKVLRFLKSLNGGGIEVVVIEDEPPAKCSKSNVYVRALSSLVPTPKDKSSIYTRKFGGSDVRHFAAEGIEGIEFGPEGRGLHSQDERVSIKSLESYYRILTQFITSLA